MSTNSYDDSFQKMLFRYMIQSPETFSRVSSIFDPENFSKPLQESAKFIQAYASAHNSMPDIEMLNTMCGTGLSETLIDGIESKTDFILDQFEKFTKQRALERAIVKAFDMLEKEADKGTSSFDPIEKLVKDAIQISLTKDLGTEYYEDPKGRLLVLKDSQGTISTGIASLDYKMFGGMNRKELNIVIACSGGGKSLFMQNMAVNWSQAKMNGVYITLELKEELCCKRMDSMSTGIPIKDINSKIDDVELRVKMARKGAGSLRVKYLPAQSNVNHIKSYLKELQIQTGVKIDFLIIDYLDLMMPISVKVNPSDLFIKDKYVAEELRNLANELDVLLLTACQFNRSAIDETSFDHSQIAGGISKIYTADNVFSINTSRSMRERGRYQLQFLKTRNSGSVDQTIDLGFDAETMKFYHVSEEESSSRASVSSVIDQVKNRTNIEKTPPWEDDKKEEKSPAPDGMVIKPKQGIDPYKVANEQVANRNKVEVKGNALKGMLAKLKEENSK